MVSFLFIVAQLCFQIVLLASPPYGEKLLPVCATKGAETVVESLLHQFGFQRLDLPQPINVLRLVCPDVIVFVCALAVNLSCLRLTRK